MYISNLNSIWAAYLNQLMGGSVVCKCGNQADNSRKERSTSFSEVLQVQRAREFNQENVIRLKEAAGGKVDATNKNVSEYQDHLLRLSYFNPYGLGGWGSFWGTKW